jgi:RNA polymerase sigma factor (sigma-70 family)
MWNVKQGCAVMTAGATAVALDAERLLQNEYEPLKAETLRSLSGKLRARGIRCPDEDLEEYYNQAWHALYTQAASGTAIDNPGGFLVQVGFRRAIDDFRRLRPDERADLETADLAAAEQDVVQQLEDQRRLREFAEALRDELGERERVAASLCYIHGYTRPEAAKLMGISERRMQKVMDAVSKAVGRITRDIEAGNRCEARASTNKAYALGLLDPEGERHAATRAHLDECPGCRADVIRMRGLAIIAPPSLLPWAALHVGGAGGGGAAAKARRGPRSTTTAIAGAGAAVVVAAALAAVMITRDSSGPERSPAGAARPTTSAAAPGAQPATKPSDATTEQPTSKPSDATTSKPSDERAAQPTSKPSDARAKQRARKRRRAKAAPTPAPQPAAPQPAATAAPVATVSPPAATPQPVSAAPPVPSAGGESGDSKPPVLDDGVQEFGVEP